MQSNVRILFAGVVLAMTSQSIAAQSVDRNMAAPLRPFATISLGAGSTDIGAGDGPYAVSEFAVGARKRLSRRFGIVASAQAGQLRNRTGGGTFCTLECYQSVPSLNWYGASAGIDAYAGPAVVSLTAGPSSVGIDDNERRQTELKLEPTRGFGVRTQLEALFPLYRRVGLSVSAVHLTVPDHVLNPMDVTSFGLGLILR
jgi:hypothetical protein